MAIGHLDYGDVDGIKAWIKDYDDLITKGDLTVAQVEIARRDANAKIDDEFLSKVVPMTSLPLANPPGSLRGISNGFACYYILRRIYRKVEPNKSDWVDDFFTHAKENLERLIENPQVFVDAVGTVLANTGIAYKKTDPLFGIERTRDGARITNDYEESQEGW